MTLRCDTRVGHHPVPSMKPSPSYLTRNRHGTFYFRIVIPRPLRALLNGRMGVDAIAALDVVGGWADLHGFPGDVDVGQLFELVVHARQLALDVARRVGDLLLDPRDIEEHAAVW